MASIASYVTSHAWLQDEKYQALERQQPRGLAVENGPDSRGKIRLVYNLQHADYVSLICGSLDRLPEAFASLDHEQHEKQLRGFPADDSQQDLESLLQIASASLSTADRRVIRTEEMDRRVAAAAKSRAPRHRR